MDSATAAASECTPKYQCQKLREKLDCMFKAAKDRDARFIEVFRSEANSRINTVPTLLELDELEKQMRGDLNELELGCDEAIRFLGYLLELYDRNQPDADITEKINSVWKQLEEAKLLKLREIIRDFSRKQDIIYKFLHEEVEVSR